MAEFYLQTRGFLEGEWKEMMGKGLGRVERCREECKGNEECLEMCGRGVVELEKLARDKEEIYVRKGVEYCKAECWEARDLGECSQRCVKDYSVLYKEFRQVLVDRYNSTRFYNN